MTRLIFQPDTEYTEGWMTLGFEVDDAATAALRDPSSSDDLRLRAYKHVTGVAMEAIKAVEANPKRYEWEIRRDKNCRNLQRDFSQETTEEMEERRLDETSVKPVTDVMKRNKENWTIQVWARRKKRLSPKYPTQLGPSDGFSAYDDLPDDYKARLKPVFAYEKGA